jgi:hypothetical protein
MEQLAYHEHARLTLMVDGKPVPVPGNIGIRPNCISWLHTHRDDGVIHVEAPEPRTYRLGDFFRVWGRSLDSPALIGSTTDTARRLAAYVNGQRYNGPPETIPLERNVVIVLHYSAPSP